MVFAEFVFIAVSDVPISEEIENPIQTKIIISKDFMIILSFDEIYCIEHLFSTLLNFKGYPSQTLDQDEGCLFITRAKSMTLRANYERRVIINESLSLQTILYKLIEIIINRYEKLVYSMIEECKTCITFSVEISYKERAEYQIRVSVAERNLIYMTQLIKPKVKILKELAKVYKKEKDFRPYFVAFSNRIKRLVCLLNNNSKILNTAKNLYHTCAEDTLSKNSFRAGELMKFYSGLATIVIPLMLMEGFWSINVNVPGFEFTDLNDFHVFLAMVGSAIA